MSNKGYPFEVELVKHFRKLLGKRLRECYRVLGSGQSKSSYLTGSQKLMKHGDVYLHIKNFPFSIKFLVEAKWYRTKGKTAKSMAIRKDWLDQCRHEAEINKCLAAFAFKMKSQNVRSKALRRYSFYGVDSNSTWVAMPLRHFTYMVKKFVESGGRSDGRSIGKS